ncbi:MAG: DUF3240 family protein [Sulfuricurvum sp.]
MNQERQLITIIVTPDIEESVVDWLLEHPEIKRFVSYQVKSYNKDYSDYTTLEKVTGWKRKTALRVLFPTEEMPNVIAQMKAKFANSGIYYRITPFLDEGVL